MLRHLRLARFDACRWAQWRERNDPHSEIRNASVLRCYAAFLRLQPSPEPVPLTIDRPQPRQSPRRALRRRVVLTYEDADARFSVESSSLLVIDRNRFSVGGIALPHNSARAAYWCSQCSSAMSGRENGTLAIVPCCGQRREIGSMPPISGRAYVGPRSSCASDVGRRGLVLLSFLMFRSTRCPRSVSKWSTSAGTSPQPQPRGTLPRPQGPSSLVPLPLPSPLGWGPGRAAAVCPCVPGAGGRRAWAARCAPVLGPFGVLPLAFSSFDGRRREDGTRKRAESVHSPEVEPARPPGVLGCGRCERRSLVGHLRGRRAVDLGNTTPPEREMDEREMDGQREDGGGFGGRAECRRRGTNPLCEVSASLKANEGSSSECQQPGVGMARLIVCCWP